MQKISEIIQEVTRRKRNIRFREMETILLDVGFNVRQQKRGGSHYVFKHPDIDTLIVLVTHGMNDLLPEYQTMKAIRALEKLREHRGPKE